MSRGKLRTVKRRINSTISTMHITRAMEMVARAKAQKAEKIWSNYRLFSEKYSNMFRKIVNSSEAINHPLIKHDNQKNSKTAILLVSSDMGLCGSFSSEIIRTAEIESRKLGKNFVGFFVIGLKASSYFKYKGIKTLKSWEKLYDIPDYDISELIIDEVLDFFERGVIDSLKVVYTKKVSTLAQIPKVVDLIPINSEKDKANIKKEYEFEPLPEELLKRFIPEFLSAQLLNYMMESKVSELYARQNAMKNATENAKDLIDNLTLQYNKLRQASITREIIEVVNGSEALKEG